MSRGHHSSSSSSSVLPLHSGDLSQRVSPSQSQQTMLSRTHNTSATLPVHSGGGGGGGDLSHRASPSQQHRGTAHHTSAAVDYTQQRGSQSQSQQQQYRGVAHHTSATLPLYSGDCVSQRAAVDPTPVGLAGFSSIVFMVSAHYAGFVPGLDWVPSLGMIAAITLLLGSIFHFLNRNTLPATNFGVYGAFWLSISLQMYLDPKADFNHIMTMLRIPIAIFTLYAWIASFFISRASVLIFTTLEIKLLCFIVGTLSGDDRVMLVGGWFGMLCASTGFYTSASLLLKPYVHLPLGKPLVTISAKK